MFFHHGAHGEHGDDFRSPFVVVQTQYFEFERRFGEYARVSVLSVVKRKPHQRRAVMTRDSRSFSDMRIIALIAGAASLLSCTDTPATLGICERVSCADADLLVETRVTDLAQRPLTAPLAPGDTFVVHRRIENLRETATDSLWLALYARRVEDKQTLYYTYSAVERILAGFQPRQVIELTDTLQVPRYTFTRQFDLLMAIQGWTWPYESLDAVHHGDRVLNVLRSGYEIEIVAIPEQIHTGTRQITQLRHYARAGALLRIKNPYEMPLDSLRLYVCVFDIDYCAVHDSSAVVRRVPAGGETYVDFEFLVDTRNGPRDWWGRFDAGLVFCGEDLFDGRCVSVPARILANFEETCDVVTITRPSSQWFSDRDGVPEAASAMLETTIPADGTYYIAMQHRFPVQFRLVRMP